MILDFLRDFDPRLTVTLTQEGENETAILRGTEPWQRMTVTYRADNILQPLTLKTPLRVEDSRFGAADDNPLSRKLEDLCNRLHAILDGVWTFADVTRAGEWERSLCGKWEGIDIPRRLLEPHIEGDQRIEHDLTGRLYTKWGWNEKDCYHATFSTDAEGKPIMVPFSPLLVAVYEQAKAKGYPVRLTATMAEDDGFTADYQAIYGEREGGKFLLYDEYPTGPIEDMTEGHHELVFSYRLTGPDGEEQCDHGHLFHLPTAMNEIDAFYRRG